jgi:leucyl-tRNA synthetase
MDWFEEKGIGKRTTHFHLRDWLVSRQRYWGAPIPMIYCESCAKNGVGDASRGAPKPGSPSVGGFGADEGQDLQNMPGWFVVPEADLPVLLPNISDYKPEGTGKGPLANHKEFYQVKCPKCGGEATRETDVMDTFVDSSWYFFRYFSRDCQDPINRDLANLFMPIDTYIGGREHAVLHLLYCRFITKVLRDLGHINIDEPVKKLVNQGIVSMATYYNLKTKQYVYPGEIIYQEVTEESQRQLPNYDSQRKVLLFNGNGDEIEKGPLQKMSKSKKNIISPMELKETYGVDVLRFMMISDNPCDKEIEIRQEGFTGSTRFLNAVWEVSQHLLLYLDNCDNNIPVSQEKEANINKIFHQGELRLSNLEVNLFAVSLRAIITEIKDLMKNNHCRNLIKRMWRNFLKMFSVICPYISQALWELFQFNLDGDSVFAPGWLDLQDIKFQQSKENITIMLNNNICGTITIAPYDQEQEIKNKVLEFLKIEEQQVGGFFLIKNRNIVNVVVKNDSSSK